MNEKQNKSSNGFLLGMIVGGSLVFLLGTKKGRKILKNLSENGLEALEGILDIEEIESLYDGEDMSEVDSEEKTNNKNGNSFGKRFFKGVKKK